MSQPPVSPIPPMGPRPQPDPPASVEELRALLAEQRVQMTALHRRQGWVLAFAALAMVGSCSDRPTSTSGLTSEVSDLRVSVDELKREVTQMRDAIEKPAEAPSRGPSAVPGGAASAAPAPTR